ncbi:MAG: dCMP deaminase [Campylobacteraceae bacterium 4484_166]|nr:MAG: dCMP deaminase [Campylobacteraceae bacterium 4484_166]
MISDRSFINIAHEIATASKCVSKKVGAVIVKDGRVLSTGYNGTPAGYTNCNDHWDNKWSKEHHEWSKNYEIHAEMNAIIWAARNGIAIDGGTIYITLEPCSQCVKNLIACGIKKIVYDKDYKHNDSQKSLLFLRQNGVSIYKLSK